MAKTYAAYRFTRKEPAIDSTRTLIEDDFGRRVNRKDLTKIEEDGGPNTGTMVAWFFGRTQRPQNATIEAAGRALGYQRKWVRANGR